MGEKYKMKKYQSVKVYVIDFHFEAGNKEAISKEKIRLDKFFDELVDYLKESKNDAVQEVFLRKH